MIKTHGLRELKLSHRISLLFFFCGILPLAALLVLFFYYLENDLKNQSLRDLDHQAKSVRGMIFERLQMAENEIRVFHSHRPGPDRAPVASSPPPAGRIELKCLENLFRVGRNGAVFLLGKGAPSCDVSFGELGPGDSEKPVILKRNRPRGYPHLWMAVRTSPAEWLVGRIDPGYLWNEGSNFNLPYNTELCVVDEENVPLVSSRPESKPVIAALVRSKGNASEFSWSDGKQDYLAAANGLFLSGGFLADSWKIVLSRPKESILSSIHRYKIYFLLLGFLTMLAAILLSQVSIRRSLRPLRQLLLRTKAIANEDFSGGAPIRGSPEFQELLDAFGVMSRKIEKKVAERTLDLKNANEDLSHEIRQRIRAEEELNRAKESAEIANRAKSEFLANMSHELRTPLNHIIGFTELVVDKHFGALNETQEEYLNDVLTSSGHLLSLINDILDLSKVEAGKLTLELSAVRLRVLLEGSLVMIREKALKHGIRISQSFDGIPETIRADERKLKQVLYNLLSNAMKFTPDGGALSLSATYLSYRDGQWVSGETRPPALPPDADSPLLREGAVLISLQDTGVGIGPEDLERIFEPFEQVENSLSRLFQGTGLGLSLSRRMVGLHGGKIWAESEGKGKGSRFNFVIPANPSHGSAEDR